MMFEQFYKSGLLAVFLAVIGWYIVYKNSRALAKKSECNTFVNDIDKLLQEISNSTYEFWKERVIDDQSTFKSQSRIFELNIGHKCDLIEEKINYLYDKSIKDTVYEIACEPKHNASIILLADVRNKSTLNSERLLDTKQELPKYKRIAQTHATTIKLSKAVHEIITTRYEKKGVIATRDRLRYHSIRTTNYLTFHFLRTNNYFLKQHDIIIRVSKKAYQCLKSRPSPKK